MWLKVESELVGRLPCFKLIMCLVYKIILHRSMGATIVFDTVNMNTPSRVYLYQGSLLGAKSPRPLRLRLLATFLRATSVI